MILKHLFFFNREFKIDSKIDVIVGPSFTVLSHHSIRLSFLFNGQFGDSEFQNLKHTAQSCNQNQSVQKAYKEIQ